MDNKEYLDLYKIAVDEEHQDVDTHHKIVMFFASYISGLFVTTFIGLRFAEKWYELLFLIILPVLCYILGDLAIKVSAQYYIRFLDSVTMRGKIEQILGLTDKGHLTDPNKNSYWADEPLIPTRNLLSRRADDFKVFINAKGKSYEGSQAWVQAHMDKGYHKSVKKFFNVTNIISVVMIVGLVFMAIYKY